MNEKISRIANRVQNAQEVIRLAFDDDLGENANNWLTDIRYELFFIEEVMSDMVTMADIKWDNAKHLGVQAEGVSTGKIYTMVKGPSAGGHAIDVVYYEESGDLVATQVFPRSVRLRNDLPKAKFQELD